jgi:hypothetical protein
MHSSLVDRNALSIHDVDSLCMTTVRRWYDGENTMVRWWNNDCTMMKLWWYDCENAMVWWWKHDGTMDGTMVTMLWYDGKTRWYNHHRHHRAIAASWFHHRAIVVSSSCLRVFIIVPSYNSVFTIFKSCIAVQADKKCNLCSNGTPK